jgi:Pyridoxal-phosphate dependent enzyme
MDNQNEGPIPRFDPPGRGRIYDNIIETMGNTPLVRVRRLGKAEGIEADVLLKLEFFNPLASVKDRIGVNMCRSDCRPHAGDASSGRAAPPIFQSVSFRQGHRSFGTLLSRAISSAKNKSGWGGGNA